MCTTYIVPPLKKNTDDVWNKYYLEVDIYIYIMNSMQHMW